MTNTPVGVITSITVNNQAIEEVQNFIYLGATISEEGSRTEIIRRIAQSTDILTTLKTIWKDKNIALKSKIRLMRSLIVSLFPCTLENRTRTSYLQRILQAL